MNVAAVVWLCLVGVFLFVEVNTVALVSAWFAGGALAAMAAALLGGDVSLQVVLFVAVSGLLLALLRPILRRFITPKQVKTNIDAIIGTKGMVLQEINNDLSRGKVKLGAMEWTARSANGEVIAPGTQVVVESIEGVKLIVSPAQVREAVKE